MCSLELVRFPDLMKPRQGWLEIAVALVDGSLALDLAELATGNMREIPGKLKGNCACTDPARRAGWVAI
jgi:hypothetical protein